MSFSPQTPQAGEPVIIDTDPGIDDALALVLAAASSMRIEGVTIVHGNGKDVRQLGTDVCVHGCVSASDLYA